MSQDDGMPDEQLTAIDRSLQDTIGRDGPATPQVARLGELDQVVLERVRHEALTALVPWVAEYGPYQSGGWWTASLLNETGDAVDVAIRDCDPIPTELLRRMPATQRFLAALDLPYMWVRLAKLAPNSFLWEHRDYADLRATPRQRLHVPLVTNPSAALVTGGTRIHLRSGHMWRLFPTYAHGACNMLGPDRLHLIIDTYVGPRLDDLTSTERLDPSEVHRLPQPAEADLHESMSTARGMVEMGFVPSAEKYLLRLFYRYALPEGCIYDLIVDLHRSLGRAEAAARWTGLRATLLDGAAHQRASTGSGSR